MTSYRNLEAWKRSMELVTHVYLFARNIPKEEVYALTSQIKRSAVSIPINIAEGMGRNHKNDSIQFFHISRGSLYELETLLEIALRLNFLSESGYTELTNKITGCMKVLNGLINYFEKATLK